MKILLTRVAVGCCALLVAVGARADDGGKVQAASLEVKARIASMEQVNVTAEIPVDDTAPAASAKVAALLQDVLLVEQLENGDQPVFDSASAQAASTQTKATPR